MRVWLVFALILLASCSTQRLKKEQAEWLGKFGTIAPPGTIAVNDSLYYDKAEASNEYWLEYIQWQDAVFQFGNREYRAPLPDTTVWCKGALCDSSMVLHYLRHPAYREYPVVGVTYEKALAYSKWRSDRVMEVFLIKAGVIPFDQDQSYEDHFTIERYYATDSLKAYHHLPYPSYDLPSPSEWLMATVLSDSLAKLNLKKCRLRMSPFRGADWAYCEELVREGSFIINSKEESARRPDLTVPCDCFCCHEPLFWHLRGNVAELCKDSTLVFGGGWTDPLDSIHLDQPFPHYVPNAATGFRNVCRWRNWDGVRH